MSAQEGEQMEVRISASIRGGFDAVALVDGALFEGHGGTAEQAEAEARAHVQAYLEMLADRRGGQELAFIRSLRGTL
jgi:hypothetical protein